MIDATPTSSSETEEVSAATTSARKNEKPTTRPTVPISANAPGSEMNSAPSVAPCTSSERPNAKITGNTTRPPTKAIEKSENDTTTASRPTFSRFEMYDPYVIMMPIPTLSDRKAWLAACLITVGSKRSSMDGVR